MRSEVQILPLDGSATASLGGKGEGLARLLALGFRVPAGFAVEGVSPASIPFTSKGTI